MKDEIHTCELIELYRFLGKKWSIILLHNVSSVPITYNELNRLMERKISSILLSKRLKEMIKLKLIKKEIINGRISYTVSEIGSELKEMLHEIKNWSINHSYNLPRQCKRGRCICGELFRK